MKSILPAFIFLLACTSPSENKLQTESNVLNLERYKTEIHYLEAGVGDSTLLFLHGWNINKHYWEDQLNYFANRHKVYALDLPGFGESISDRENWTIEEYAKDVSEFIESLELQNVVLVGHSMSGGIMLEAALLSEESIIGLVGIDNLKMVGLESPPGWDEQVEEIVKQMKADYKQVVAEYASAWLFNPATDSIDRMRVLDDYRNADPPVAISSFESIVSDPDRERKAIKKLNLKLNLLQGGGMHTYTVVLDSICSGGYEIIEISEVGHFPMIEKPEEFNQGLEKLLEKL